MSATCSPSAVSGTPAFVDRRRPSSRWPGWRARAPVRMNPRALLRRLRLRLHVPAAARGASVRIVLDGRLELAAPDADGPADALRPLARGDRLAARCRGCRSSPVTMTTSTIPATTATTQASGPRIALPPGLESSSTTATRSCQKRSTVGILTRSSGECGNSICGPNDSMSSSCSTLPPMTARLEPGVHGGHDRRLAEEALVDGLRRRERRRVEVRPPAAVVELHLEGAAGETGGRVERGDHVGHRGVVGGARQAVQRQLVAVGDRLAERGRRLDEVVEVRAHRERPRGDERDRVEEPSRSPPRVHGSLAEASAGVDRDRDARVRLGERVADRRRPPSRSPREARPRRSAATETTATASRGIALRLLPPSSETSRNGTVACASRSARPSTLIAFERPSAMPGARVPALPSARP